MEPLSYSDFKEFVKNGPLASIDFNILNELNESLLLYRLTPPASKKFFTPGGRIFKDEKINEAIKRILKNEINFNVKDSLSIKFIKVNEHFYPDSAFDKSTSTHYINLLYEIRVEKKALTGLDEDFDDHESIKWINKDEINKYEIHEYAIQNIIY